MSLENDVVVSTSFETDNCFHCGASIRHPTLVTMQAKTVIWVYGDKIELVFCDDCAVTVAHKLLDQVIVNKKIRE